MKLTSESNRDLSALTNALAAVLSTVDASDLALRGLRIHARISTGSSVWEGTLDCTRSEPRACLGFSGSPHLVVHMDESALVPLLAANSFRDIFRYLGDGSIRLLRGAQIYGPIFTALRLVREPAVPRDNAVLRSALRATFNATASTTEL